MMALIRRHIYILPSPRVKNKLWRLIAAAPKLFSSRGIKMLFIFRSPRTLFLHACQRGTNAFKQRLSQQNIDIIENKPPESGETLSTTLTLVQDETASVDTKVDELPKLIVTAPSGTIFVLQDKMPAFKNLRKKKKQKKRRDKWRKSSMLSPLWVPKEGPKPCDVKRFTTVGYLLKRPSRGRWQEMIEETSEPIDWRKRQKLSLTTVNEAEDVQP